MQPRVIYRTHYQVDEPAYMELAVTRCTSPVQSSYRDQVAEKIAQEIQRRGRSFNTAAGGYAIDLGYALDLLTPQNTWSAKGHLLNLVASIGEGELASEVTLNDQEKLLHFRLFLEADGAALVFLAQKLLELGRLPPTENGSWNALALEMFVAIYKDYLTLASLTQDRVAIRQQLNRLESAGFAGKTGAHKMFLHLHVLYRLGLTEFEEAGGRRTYELAPSARGPLETLVAGLKSAHALDEVFRKERWIELAAGVLAPGAVPVAEFTVEELLGLIVGQYQTVVATGVPLCPIAPLIDAVQIALLAERGTVLPSDVASTMLREAQRQAPREIRFHVDRTGRPAYLKLSPEFVERVGSWHLGART